MIGLTQDGGSIVGMNKSEAKLHQIYQAVMSTSRINKNKSRPWSFVSAKTKTNWQLRFALYGTLPPQIILLIVNLNRKN